ncbi:MAG: hypothetical protein Q7R47_04790, partial [Candidatus Diapherotrites archaeon]|nr:hypothetical protein [Candidatus Diapherotrites archaeon]
VLGRAWDWGMDMENDGTVNIENEYYRAIHDAGTAFSKKAGEKRGAPKAPRYRCAPSKGRIGSAQGQLSIEFMLVVVVSIVYLNTVIFPQVAFGQTVLSEIDGLAQTRTSANQIVNAINALAIQSPNAKQTLTVLIPKNALITCDNTNKKIGFEYTLQSEPSEKCDPDTTGKKLKCTKSISTGLSASQSLACTNFGVNGISGPQTKTIEVSNSGGSISVTAVSS